MLSPVSQAAPAKLNLYLHIIGKRADGFHLLESLAAFTAFGDRLECYPDDIVSLDVQGPFAAEVPLNAQNSVLRAAHLLKERTGCRQGARIVLHKHIPVAAGLGGGSADAAAALRALVKLWNLAVSLQDLGVIAAQLGSDVKVCVASRPAIMRGIGDELAPVTLPPGIWVVLVNPLIAVPTADVYRGFTSEYDCPSALPDLSSSKAFICALSERHNALTASAVARCSVIADALQALRDTDRCQLARMSGSGGTCFGLYTSQEDAKQAALGLKVRLPGWWLEVTSLT